MKDHLFWMYSTRQMHNRMAQITAEAIGAMMFLEKNELDVVVVDSSAIISAKRRRIE